MDLTVIICTRNRAMSLERTLASAARMIVPDGVAWELLIVDNGSTDTTQEVIGKYIGTLPIRRLREPVRGVSNARNCGMLNAQGKYILWTDDDVVIDQNWLAAYAEAFHSHPEAAIFFGKVIPVLEEPSPSWFKNNLSLFADLTATRDFGSEELPISVDEERVPYGANYALRTREHREFLYNPNLGPGSNSGAYGEETDVIVSMIRAGAAGWWIPKAAVRHIIPSDRQTIKYLITYYRSHGITIYMTSYKRSGKRGKRITVTYAAARTAVGYLIWKAAYWLNLERMWIQRLKGYAFWRGVLHGLSSERHGAER